MTRYLTLDEVVELHRLAMAKSGGSTGIRDHGALDSAVSQPRMAFCGQDLYPSVAEKAAALAYSLVCNHPFVDGNKRVGHAAMETYLVLNGWELIAQVKRLLLGSKRTCRSAPHSGNNYRGLV